MTTNRVNDKCPYDKTHNNTGIVRGRYARCPECNKNAIVVIYDHAGGTKTAELVKAGRKPSPDRKEVYCIRLSGQNKIDVINGKAKILPSKGNSLELVYMVSV